MSRNDKLGFVLDGANFDDTRDYRPGMKAARDFDVRSPLKEAGMTKEDIRIISRQMDLPTWDRPASPCLASRIPYGSEITLDKLTRIDKAESFLKSLGISELRVRDHDNIARIEVPRESMALFLENSTATEISGKLKSLGYKYITLDIQGYRTGSMNEVLRSDKRKPQERNE
jgi:uncharacterized protein